MHVAENDGLVERRRGRRREPAAAGPLPTHPGSVSVDFTTDYYKPFAVRFAKRIRRPHPHRRLPGNGTRSPSTTLERGRSIRNRLGASLVRRAYPRPQALLHPGWDLDFGDTRLVVREGRVRRSFSAQLGAQRRGAAERLGGVPTLIGEIGIPFDLDEKRAYRTGDFRNQARALDRSLHAVEANQLSATLWDYTADNTNAQR